MRQLLNKGMDLIPLATIGCGQPHISQRSADQFATLDWFQRDRLLHKPLEQQARDRDVRRLNRNVNA